MQAFPAGDASTIQELLGGYLWKSISIRDTAVRAKRKENFPPVRLDFSK